MVLLQTWLQGAGIINLITKLKFELQWLKITQVLILYKRGLFSYLRGISPGDGHWLIDELVLYSIPTE